MVELQNADEPRKGTGLTGFLDRVFTDDVMSILRALPDDCVDVSVTSPPYNKRENKKGWLVANVKYTDATDRRSEAEYQNWQTDVLNEVFRVTKPGGSFFYNHKIRWETGELIHPYAWISKTLWTLREEIIWDRMIAANLRGWRFWQVDERIYWLYKPNGTHRIGRELESRHALLTSIWRFPPERNNPHPAPFPLQLPLRAIYSMLGDASDGVVLDPFCGTGATLIAAKILGHHYIGIDNSPTYTNLAQKRLNNYHSEEPRAQEEIALHVVRKTFAERKNSGDFTGRHGPLFRSKRKAPHQLSLPPAEGENEDPPETS